jgi:hypothetical protein
MRAAVFGRVWRFCQMKDGVCRASLETISEGLKIDRATAYRHIAELCKDGYLKDLTPDLRNRPHVYADTGKAGIRLSVSGGVAQDNTGVAERNTTVAQDNTGVAESSMSKVSKKRSKKEKKDISADAPLPPEDLSIALTPKGAILKDELTKAAESNGRRGPMKYQNVQQRDAYISVFKSLDGELQPLILRGIERGITSRSAMLAWLQGCVKNQNGRTQLQHAQPANGTSLTSAERARRVEAAIKSRT